MVQERSRDLSHRHYGNVPHAGIDSCCYQLHSPLTNAAIALLRRVCYHTLHNGSSYVNTPDSFIFYTTRRAATKHLACSSTTLHMSTSGVSSSHRHVVENKQSWFDNTWLISGNLMPVGGVRFSRDRPQTNNTLCLSSQPYRASVSMDGTKVNNTL